MERILVVLSTLTDTDRKCNISFILPPHLQEKEKKNNFTLALKGTAPVSSSYFTQTDQNTLGVFMQELSLLHRWSI